MGSFHLEIQDVLDQTTLSRKYVDKCYGRMDDVLGDTRQRSPERNKYLYTSNAVVLLRQVKDLRDAGHQIPEIHKRMVDMLFSSPLGDEGNIEPESMETEDEGQGSTEMLPGKSWNTTTVLGAVERAYELAIKSKDEAIRSKDQVLAERERVILEMNKQVLQLTESAEAYEVRKEALRQKEADLQKKFEEEKRIVADREGERQSLLDQLASLNGKAFKRKQRSQLIEKLRLLNKNTD